MKKLLASTTAVLALTGAAVTGMGGLPGGGAEPAEAATTTQGCSTWMYKLDAKKNVAEFGAPIHWVGPAYKGYYVTTNKPWTEWHKVGESQKPTKLMEINRVYNANKSDFTRMYTDNPSTTTLYVTKTNLKSAGCW